jgi:DNA-binding CsgD family transcriptional regulator
MRPNDRAYARAARQVNSALAIAETTPDAVIRDFLEATWDVLGVSGSCWHLTDPCSGLPVSSGAAGDPPGSLEWSLEFEYARPDVSRFAELRERRDPVAAISSETRGTPAASARFREMIRPAGAVDELRVAFRDPFGVWATIAVFTTRRMTRDDLGFVAATVPVGSAALRAATVRAVATPVEATRPRAPDPGGPSVVILGADDAIVAADAVSRARLEAVPEDRDVSLPGIVSVLAAQARCSPATDQTSARMRAVDGRWLQLHASPLQDHPGSVAVVIAPAPLDEVRDGVLRALGVSARERQVALLSLQGMSAKEIARDLQISQWTAKDHLKAVYAKTGVTCRADLTALAESRSFPPAQGVVDHA